METSIYAAIFHRQRYRRARHVCKSASHGAVSEGLAQLLQLGILHLPKVAWLDVKVPVQRSEVSDCAILPNTAAYLECSVADRMEGGDHWIVYAEVTHGKVVTEGALSSVHHRKVGTTY